MLSMTIDQLNLSPVMDQRARELQIAFPSVIYLSGRRDVRAQAHAMATHVVTDKHWIARVYLHAADLQTSVDTYLGPWNVQALEHLLFTRMMAMAPDVLARVSDHLSGNAVDLLPLEDANGQMTPTGQAVYQWIYDCPDTKKFLMREGGKVIWHWACTESATV